MQSNNVLLGNAPTIRFHTVKPSVLEAVFFIFFHFSQTCTVIWNNMGVTLHPFYINFLIIV